MSPGLQVQIGSGVLTILAVLVALSFVEKLRQDPKWQRLAWLNPVLTGIAIAGGAFVFSIWGLLYEQTWAAWVAFALLILASAWYNGGRSLGYL